MYKNYITKSAVKYYNYLISHGGHANYIEVEDLEQIAMFEIAKCYNKYDINYESKGFENNNDKIGFFPIMDKNVQGAMLRHCRDALKKRRKDYNIHEIGLDYFDAPISNDKGDSEIYLSDIIPSQEDEFENLQMKLEVESLLSQVSELEKNIITDIYLNNMTQVNVGKKYGISQVQVSRIQSKAIKRMRNIATSKNNQTERNVDMKSKQKVVISFKDLNDFLVENVDKYLTLHHAIVDYARNNSLSKNDIYSMLENRKGAYSSIKELYNSRQADEIEQPQEIFEFEEKVFEKPVIQEAEKVIEPVKVEINPINIFGSLNIESFNMVVNLNSIKAEVTNEGVKLINIPKGYLSQKDLLDLKESIDKAIEISNTFCK